MAQALSIAVPKLAQHLPRVSCQGSGVSLIMRGVRRSVEAEAYEVPRSPSALDIVGAAATVSEAGVIAIPVTPAGAEKTGVETIDAGKVKTGTGPVGIVGVALGEASNPVRLNKNERLGFLVNDLANRAKATHAVGAPPVGEADVPRAVCVSGSKSDAGEAGSVGTAPKEG
jgi:hypothetical protein